MSTADQTPPALLPLLADRVARRRIAVVGGGLMGTATAYATARLGGPGVAVDLYEAQQIGYEGAASIDTVCLFRHAYGAFSDPLPARHPGPPARSWRGRRQTSRSGARDADGATVGWVWTDSGMVGLPRTPRYYRFSPDLTCEQLMRTGLADLCTSTRDPRPTGRAFARSSRQTMYLSAWSSRTARAISTAFWTAAALATRVVVFEELLVLDGVDPVDHPPLAKPEPLGEARGCYELFGPSSISECLGLGRKSASWAASDASPEIADCAEVHNRLYCRPPPCSSWP